MTTTTQGARLHPILWLAAIAVTAFSAVGIAAIAGWLPAAGGHQELNSESRMAAAEAASQSDPAPARSAEPAAVEPRARAAARSKPAPSAPAAVAQAADAPLSRCADCGTVEYVRAVTTQAKPSGVGVVAGGVIGGVLGNQVGKGSGRDLATIGGAVLGGIAGNEVEKRSRTASHYEVAVRLDSGERQTVRLDYLPQWREGERVTLRHGALSPLNGG